MNTKQKIGIMPGGFNLLHVGHLTALKEAKDNCDRLIVVVVRDQSTKGSKLYQENIQDRYIKLNATKYVDEVIPCENEDDLLELLCILDYDVYFMSEEYVMHGFEVGKKIVTEEKIHYLKRKHNWSTTNEVLKIKENYERLHLENKSSDLRSEGRKTETDGSC